MSIYKTSFGGGGCGVYGWGHRLSRRTDRLKSFLSYNEEISISTITLLVKTLIMLNSLI